MSKYFANMKKVFTFEKQKTTTKKIIQELESSYLKRKILITNSLHPDFMNLVEVIGVKGSDKEIYLVTSTGNRIFSEEEFYKPLKQ